MTGQSFDPDPRRQASPGDSDASTDGSGGQADVAGGADLKGLADTGAKAGALDVKSFIWRSKVEFFVNGRAVSADGVEPHHTLLFHLRDKLGLTGTKLGCGEGGCGACTVSVAHFDHAKGAVVHRAVNACLAPLCSVDGCAVTTVEGIGTTRAPHPVQKRISEMHGSQCGFCTPGIVMSLYSTLRRNSAPSMADIEASFDGNLCRCTGYRPILDAAKTFACDKHACPKPPSGFDDESAKPESEGDALVCSSTATKLAKAGGAEAAALQKPAFPEQLKGPALAQRTPLKVAGGRVTWYAPTDLASLLALKKAFPEAKLVAGNTEVGIETKFKHCEYPVMVSTAGVPELQSLSLDPASGALLVGGAVTLSRLEHFLEEELKQRPQGPMCRLQAMLDMLRWFASTQIRNVAVLAGNIATASPISDMNPVLMALGATVLLGSAGAAPREVPVAEFFKKYRTVDMLPHELICAVRVPPARGPHEFVRSFKQAKRRDDDISIANACLLVRLNPRPEGWAVEEVSGAFGGMAPTTTRAKKMEAALRGRVWEEGMLEAAYAALAEDLPLPEVVPGGMAAYRQTLTASFLFKFFVGVSLELSKLAVGAGAAGLPAAPKISEGEASAAKSFVSEDRPLSHGCQRFHVPSGGLQVSSVAAASGQDHEEMPDKSRAPVGQPMQHVAALAQCTGEALYVDDMPSQRDTLHAAFVLSEKPHAKILSIDSSAAEASEGVAGFFSAKDLGEHDNEWGPIRYDEQLFRRDTVTSTGQPIGLIVADTQEAAQRAARLVKVQYADLPPVLTIQDAIKEKSYISNITKTDFLKIEDGDVDGALAASDTVVVEGELRLGGQEHFYLETMTAHVVPGENDELTIYTSTQTPMKTQKFAAHACGIPNSKVVCRMKRMGGGFGGKETRTVFISSAAALAAHRLKRPVRINLDRDVDMWITGTRHPFYGKYRAGAGPDGRLRALDIQMYCNAGFSMDLSEPIIGRALFHGDNTYRIPNVRAHGYMCLTNTVSNTAYRGFGGPQGLILAEAWIDHLATALKMRPEEVRERNLYASGDRTHFYQVLDRCPVQRMWKELAESSELTCRQVAVEQFNKENRWRKRGIAMLPTKFGISFTAKFMNQAGALVHVYTDGTVLVTHGGTEMGQGLHTKMVQVTARAFGIPTADVHIRETATDTVPNSSPTAASASSDLYGMAILNACEQISARLKPYLESAGGDFKKAANSAFFDRCDLSAHGFYKTPGIGYDWSKPNAERGTPFNYFTYGAACSEVEVDTLTGDTRILRADLIMDLGNSLNPAIDVGQIEGAFTQGVGWTMMEETMWGCDELSWLRPGACHTRGPGTYKIPAFNDTPVDFRVTLLKDSANAKAIHSSRAVGEPPFFLGASAFFAARMAIASARADAGLSGHFVVDSPLTPERIRLACGDRLAEGFLAKCQTRPRPSGFW